jgi:hypothetical protein
MAAVSIVRLDDRNLALISTSAKVALKITDSLARRYVGIKMNDVNGIRFAECGVRSEKQVRAFSTPRGA